MTELRAVCDTNVFVAALLSRNPRSPNRELLQRWELGQFTLITGQPLIDELAEKLEAHGFTIEQIRVFLERLVALAEWVDVPPAAIESVLPDPDDNVVLACAVLGHASHLVTYDPHFDSLNSQYQGVHILKALPFLWLVRGDTPPTAPSH